MSLLKLFITTTVDDRVPRGTTGSVPIKKCGPVMTIQRDEPLPRVFRKLATEGFTSAPVLDYDGKTYIGFLSLLDLVKFTTNLFWGNTEEAWLDFWSKQEKFQETLVEDVMKFPDEWMRDPAAPIPKQMSHYWATEHFVANNIHRTAIVNRKTKRVENIMTQSMILSFLRQHKDKLGSLRYKRVRDFDDRFTKDVISCIDTEKAINAFNKMVDEKISGLAIVNASGELVNALSLKDLRGVGVNGENFFRLFRTIREYKRKCLEDFPKRATWVHYSNKDVPLSGLYVTEDSTFEDILRIMDDGNIHRVFVCNVVRGKPYPKKVISQREILLECLLHMQKTA